MTRVLSFFRRNLRRLIVIAVLFAVGFGITSYVLAQQSSQPGETTKVERKNLQEELTISGIVRADEHVTLRFQTSGYLTWVGVKEGDTIKKNQVVASLDQRILQKQLQQDLNDYMSERWDLDQTRENYENQIYTDTIQRLVDQAQFSVNNSVSSVEIQAITIQFANLWSPIQGLVTRVNAPFAGVNITPSQAEFEVVNPQTVYFSAGADQTELPSITVGMTGSLELDAFPDEQLTGTVTSISFTPESTEIGTVYEVKFAFAPDNSNYKYRLGMTGDLSFVTSEKKDVLSVPAKYIQSESGKKYVWVLKGNQKQKTFVTEGIETEDGVEITSGVVEGDVISTTP